MCPLIDYKSTINNSVIRWELYSPEDNIVAKFAFEEWSKIASDVDTEQELEELFINCSEEDKPYLQYIYLIFPYYLTKMYYFHII